MKQQQISPSIKNYCRVGPKPKFRIRHDRILNIRRILEKVSDPVGFGIHHIRSRSVPSSSFSLIRLWYDVHDGRKIMAVMQVNLQMTTFVRSFVIAVRGPAYSGPQCCDLM